MDVRIPIEKQHAFDVTLLAVLRSCASYPLYSTLHRVSLTVHAAYMFTTSVIWWAMFAEHNEWLARKAAAKKR